MIVRKSALIEESGRWSFRGEPYTGGAIEFLEGARMCGGVYEGGRYIGPYRSAYISGDERCGIESARDDVGDQFFIAGEVYNGFAYDFLGDICVSERLFEYGWVIAEVAYYPGGEILSVELGGEITQQYKWGVSGDLVEFMLCRNDMFMVSARFPMGELHRLTLIGDYFGRVSGFLGAIKFPVLKEKIELSVLVCSAQLSLNGSGIDAAVVKYLLDGKSAGRIKELHLDCIGCSPEMLGEVKGLDQLAEIKVFAKGEVRDAWYQWCYEFRSLHPRCKVYFNGRVVDLAH